MTEDIARFLVSDAGSALLDRADTLRAARTETLTALTRLRKFAEPEYAAAAWEMSGLRRRAVVKFGDDAHRMFFTRESLEQASSRRASVYHARCFAEAGATHVNDLCGGIGGDTLAFARQGLSVTLYELDAARALFARANSIACGLQGMVDVVAEDVTRALLKPGAAWFDPARREDSRRIPSPDDYLPPLPFVRTLAAQGISTYGVKLSPAIDHSLALDYDCALEFISDGGECKEAVLWHGMVSHSQSVSAVLLTDTVPCTLYLDNTVPAPIETSETARYLYEPDPAVIRAHLVAPLARQLNASVIDSHIAYLVSEELIPTPYATAYAIVERFDYSRRRLQETLTRRGIGRVVIKKRGFPQEPEDIRRSLKLKGAQEMIVVLTRRGETHHVLLVTPAGNQHTPAEVQVL